PPMFAATTIADEILDLKQQRKAILLAHHYQEPEIQELADVVGDSLELARKAREAEGDVIAFCGVWFMAETAKVLNPSRTVIVPDKAASCSLVEGCPSSPSANSSAATRIMRSSAISIRRSRSKRSRTSSALPETLLKSSIPFRRRSRFSSSRTAISAIM